jgi:hypothetical protein
VFPLRREGDCGWHASTSGGLINVKTSPYLNRLALLVVLLVIIAGCGDRSSDRGSDGAASIEDRIRATLEDGPFTAEARRQIALLADTLEANDGEAYSTLRRIGPDALPALLEAAVGPYNETIKWNALRMVGGLGVAAEPALPFLEEIEVTSPTWVSYSAKQARQEIDQSITCGLPGLPEDVKVHVVGRYKGEKELDIQLGNSGHLVTQIEVIVDRTDYPVVLFLSAYDPVVWKVGRTPEANLVAVLVSGYHTQALLGIPRDLPHKVISGEQSVGCRVLDIASASDAATAEIDMVSLTGHGIHKYYDASPYPYFKIGGSSYSEPTRVSFSEDLSLSDYPVYEGEIPAGNRGLDELQHQGKIRPATPEDVDAWRDGARTRDPELVVRLYPETAYVVLDDIELPPGLFGAHSRMFIIPSDVSKPKGPKGHCQFFYMKDYTRE